MVELVAEPGSGGYVLELIGPQAVADPQDPALASEHPRDHVHVLVRGGAGAEFGGRGGRLQAVKNLRGESSVGLEVQTAEGEAAGVLLERLKRGGEDASGGLSWEKES